MQGMRRGEKYWWRLPITDAHAIASLASRYTLSFPVAQVLLNRGITSPDDVERFLFGTFEQEVFSAILMKDLEKAVDRLLYAIACKEPILVFGDYDVDGITSTSLMMVCLIPLGAVVNFYLPHRLKDGYGLSTKIVERAAKNNYKLIITVDNGITAFEPAKRAQELGIDLIITDHHRVHDAVPHAHAIVNPNQSDCQYPFKYFAGVGVIFKLLSRLYERLGRPLPSKSYELLLLGTVADVVPITGENRFWVRYALSMINKHESKSFSLLKQNGNLVKDNITSTDIGFLIAPQINALGRLDDPRQGVKFLIGSDDQEVNDVARILKILNEQRKEVERSVLADVEHEIAQKNIDLGSENIILAASKSWQPGVIGLVAGRLVSTYNRPTLLLHLSSDGLAKGSCRSIPEFNMFNALKSLQDLLIQFGGHSVAAGLSLQESNIALLKSGLEELITQQLTPFDLEPKLTVDAYLTLSEVTQKTAGDVSRLEPFGSQNRCPLFCIDDVTLVNKPILLKDAHVKCSILSQGVIKPIIFFNRPALYERLLVQKDTPFCVVAQISENEWQARRTIELQGHDVLLK